MSWHQAFRAIAEERDPERLLVSAVAQVASLVGAPIVALVVRDDGGQLIAGGVGCAIDVVESDAFERAWSATDAPPRVKLTRFGLEGHRGLIVLLRDAQLSPREEELLEAVTCHIGLAWVAATERVRARATDSVYRTLVEQLPAVTYYRALDKPGIPSFLSPQVTDLFGYSPEEVLADPDFFRSRVHPEDRAVITSNQPASRQAGGQPMRVEYRLQHRDGSYRWVHNHALSVRADPDSARIVLGVIIDVTHQKEAEEAKREANDAWKSSFAKRRSWTPWGGSQVGSPTTSTTCSALSSDTRSSSSGAASWTTRARTTSRRSPRRRSEPSGSQHNS